MNYQIYGTVSAVALIAANAALAGSPGPIAAIIPPVVASVTSSPFDGFYLGAAVTSTSGEAIVTGTEDGVPVGPPLSVDVSGVGGAVYAGYNIARAPVGYFYGGEISYGFPNAALNDGLSDFSEFDSLLILRGRFGYVSGPLMYYGLAGYATGTLECEFCGGLGFEGTLNGYVLGAGVEYMITDSLSVRGQYEYFDMGQPDGEVGYVASTNLTASVFSAGLSYHF